MSRHRQFLLLVILAALLLWSRHHVFQSSLGSLDGAPLVSEITLPTRPLAPPDDDSRDAALVQGTRSNIPTRTTESIDHLELPRSGATITLFHDRDRQQSQQAPTTTTSQIAAPPPVPSPTEPPSAIVRSHDMAPCYGNRRDCTRSEQLDFFLRRGRLGPTTGGGSSGAAAAVGVGDQFIPLFVKFHKVGSGTVSEAFRRHCGQVSQRLGYHNLNRNNNSSSLLLPFVGAFGGHGLTSSSLPLSSPSTATSSTSSSPSSSSSSSQQQSAMTMAAVMATATQPSLTNQGGSGGPLFPYPWRPRPGVYCGKTPHEHASLKM